MGKHIKMYLKNRLDKRGMDLSGSGQGKEAGCCDQGNEPSFSIKCGNLFTSFSRRTLLHGVSYENRCSLQEHHPHRVAITPSVVTSGYLKILTRLERRNTTVTMCIYITLYRHLPLCTWTRRKSREWVSINCVLFLLCHKCKQTNFLYSSNTITICSHIRTTNQRPN